MKIIFLFFCVLNFVSARTYTPRDLAAMAEARAPFIKMQLEGKSAAQNQILQAKTLANPVLTFQSGSLKSGTRAGAVVDITLNQPFPWPGRRQALINGSEILKQITEVDLEESRLIINNSVNVLSIEIASLIELEKHHTDRKHRFSLIHRFLTTRPLASPKQRIDRAMIEAQIKLVENLMNELTAKKNALIYQLQVLTGEGDPQISFDWKNVNKPLDQGAYLKLIEESPRLRRSEKFRQYANNKVEEARLQARPDIMFGVNYRQENIEPTNHFYHAQLAVVIPIIDRGQHSVEVARANVRKEEANSKLVSQDTLNQLSVNYQSLLSAYKGTHLFKISDLPGVEKNFHEAEDAFRKGRIDAMTLLQTDTQIHESVDLAYTSYLKYYTALAQLMILTGQKMEI